MQSERVFSVDFFVKPEMEEYPVEPVENLLRLILMVYSFVLDEGWVMNQLL
jgi:hypothetical protein